MPESLFNKVAGLRPVFTEPLQRLLLSLAGILIRDQILLFLLLLFLSLFAVLYVMLHAIA